MALAALISASPPAVAAITVTDTLGRTVTLAAPPHRLLLAEGMLIQTLGLLDRTPVGLLAGWGGDLKTLEPAIYRAYLAAFPALAEVPVVGMGSGESFSLEKALALAPDLAIFSAWQLPGGADDPMLKVFAAAGVPVVVVDFYRDPLKNSVASIELLGKALGREREAAAFTDFYRARLGMIRARLAAGPMARPTVMLHAYPGLWPCCWSAGAGGIGAFLTLLGGHNIGAERFPTENGGQLSLEYLMDRDPDVYIASGLPQLAQPGALSVGFGIDPAQARASLAGVMATPGLADLSAHRNGRVHGLWNFFNGSPLNILGLEALAKWLQPSLFADLDPEADRREINRRFLAVPFEGTYWVDLREARRP